MNSRVLLRGGGLPSLIVALALQASTVWGQWTNAAGSLEELRAQLTAHVTDPRFNQAHWSIQIASLDTGKTVFEHHSDRLMSPASNCKLYTGAVALDRLGRDYRIKTSVLATEGLARSGRLKGDVIVVGRGDPSWRLDSEGTNFWSLFDPFVAVLTNAGVKRISGDIIADATFFRGKPSGASWTVDDMEDYYGAEISAVTLMDNYVSLRVMPGAEPGAPARLELTQPHTGLVLHNRTATLTNGAPTRLQARRVLGETALYVFGGIAMDAEPWVEEVTVPRPADWFARGLKAALERSGVRVGGQGRGVRWPETSAVSSNVVLLGEVRSPPLRQMVSDFMKPSQNLETDLILDHLGETTRKASTPEWRTSEQLGVAELEQFLREHGLPADDLHFDEGSGLSRNNLTSARLTVELLKLMTRHPASNDFLTALPEAGVDGTLRRRMKGTPGERNVRAKTGTLRWVNALSGHVTSAAGEPFVFSLMLNRNVAGPGRSGRDELEAIALMLARSSCRSDVGLASIVADHGTLILEPMSAAPFPHPTRAEGHDYRGTRYSASNHYQDSTVALFIPKGFRQTEPVDVVVYFHGWRNSAIRSIAEARLIEQFSRSGRNAVLVVPTGPLNAPDSSGGKLDDAGGFTRLMDEVVLKLVEQGVLSDPSRGIGRIILSGHSGGYRVIARILAQDELAAQVQDVWLFDGLYAEVETFLGWQANQDGRLIILYTDNGGTLGETMRAMELVEGKQGNYLATSDHKLKDSDLRTHRIIFVRTDLGHGEVASKSGLFARFLETSVVDHQ